MGGHEGNDELSRIFEAEPSGIFDKVTSVLSDLSRAAISIDIRAAPSEGGVTVLEN